MSCAMSLFQRALGTSLHSRFVARSEDLGRELSDDETCKEAQYLLETIPYGGHEEEETKIAVRELKALLRKRI